MTLTEHGVKGELNPSKLHISKCRNLQNMYFGTSLIKICQVLSELWTFDDFKMADMGAAIFEYINRFHKFSNYYLTGISSHKQGLFC